MQNAYHIIIAEFYFCSKADVHLIPSRNEGQLVKNISLSGNSICVAKILSDQEKKASYGVNTRNV